MRLRRLAVLAVLGCGIVAARAAEPAADWAFRPVTRPAVPKVRAAAAVRNPADAFLLARLEANGLRYAAPADRAALVRRLAYDLTGLPPTPDEIDAFTNDQSADAYEKMVDRLLASP